MELSITQSELPDPTALYNQGKQDLGNISELKVGAGSSIFFTDKEGSRWGHTQFDLAQAFIKVDGSYKFKLADGTVILDSLGTGGNYVNIINSALNSASKTILSDFTFQATDYAGAFKAGNPTWDTVTGLITGGSGVLINARGILGANTGVATFTLDATTGNATFAGTLTAATGTLGALTIASGGNIKFGKTAYTDDTNAGLWLGDVSGVAKFNIGSSATKYLHYDGTDLTMLGGIITGATIQTATSGYRIKLDTANMKFFSDGNQKGYLEYVVAGVELKANDILALTGGEDVQITYNKDGGTGGCVFYNDSEIVAYFNDAKDFVMNTGSIQTGNTFKSSDGSSGVNNSFDMVEYSYFSGGTLRNAYRTLTIKDGLITNVSARAEYNV